MIYCSKKCYDSARGKDAKVEFNCKQCGKLFVGYKCFNSQYCSKECFYASRNAQDVSCEICGKVFRTYGVEPSRYCSRECFATAKRDGRPRDVCTDCGQRFPRTTEFWHVNSNYADGLAYTCKECLCKRTNKWYSGNKEYAIAQARKWTREHPERRKEIANSYTARNKEKIRRYCEEHRDERADRNREYLMRHPEVRKAAMANWRSKLRGTDGRVTGKELLEQYDRQNGLCFWCSDPLDDDFQPDHYIPVSKGGSNEASNIVWSCPKCNMRKHDKMPDDFMVFLATERARPDASLSHGIADLNQCREYVL